MAKIEQRCGKGIFSLLWLGCASGAVGIAPAQTVSEIVRFGRQPLRDHFLWRESQWRGGIHATSSGNDELTACHRCANCLILPVYDVFRLAQLV